MRPETVRRLAHDAIIHLEYIDTHAMTRGGLDDPEVIELIGHIEALEAILHSMIGC